MLVWALFRVVAIGLLGTIALPVYACFRWHGAWRWASFVPVGALALLVLPMVPDWAQDATSHNLWGLLLIPMELVMCPYMVVLLYLGRRHHSRAERFHPVDPSSR
jgi:hypothetical protein